MEELQNTKTNGDTISGEMIIRFSDIKLDDFLKYRRDIRNMVGFGKIGISQTIINERALVNENNLERRPEMYREAQAAPIPPDSPVFQGGPTRSLPGQHGKIKKERKNPFLSQPSRCLLTETRLRGASHLEIINAYREKFKKTKFSDSDIIAMFNRSNGIG